MAEMNRRMNRSRFVPPPALCLRIPALQACAEDLPLVLQRPDNFPLVMGILQEITQEKVGSSRGVESTQRHGDQQVQTLTMSHVKLESVDIEDHHQNLYNMNTDLYQEWSLKGVEELLTDPEELQLRHDCYRQAHEAAALLEAPAPDEKPLFGLQSAHSQFGQKGLDQAQLLVDEKPLIQLQLANSSREQISLQAKVLPVEVDSGAKEGLNTLQAAVLANSKPQCHVVQLPSQVRVEDRVGLGELQVVKREPEGPEGHGCCSEAQTQKKQFLPDAYTISDRAVSSEVLHGKGNEVGIVPLQSKDTDTDTEINHCKKITLLGHKSQARKAESSGFPELQLQTGIKKRWIVHNVLRSTSAILALPAEFSEQEENHPGKDYSQKPPSTLAAEGRTCPTILSEKGADSPQDLADFKVEDIKPQSVSSVAELDCCELTLCLASSQPETANRAPHLSDCHALHEEKPVVKNFLGQEEHHGQCQRTNANQWQQTMKRCGLLEVSRNIGQHTMPALNQKQWMSASSMCCKDVEGSTVIMGTISKTFEHCGWSLDKTLETDVQYTLPLSNQVQLLSPTGNNITVSSSCLDGGSSRRTLQLMPESVEDGGSLLEDREIQSSTSEDDQVAEPNPTTTTESSNDNSQVEQASELNEPHKKRMRGTLPMEEKGDGVQKEKDTRCHRSDGKSWRCVRECINGAYYCQYHLRARRIGYNRRKNRDVSTQIMRSL